MTLRDYFISEIVQNFSFGEMKNYCTFENDISGNQNVDTINIHW